MCEQPLIALTAHHEAAHAVVQYRLAGFAENVSIIPTEGESLGHTEDIGSDSFNPADMEARVLSCYAGGHAQRRFDPSVGDQGCDVDDEIAADLLHRFGWEQREPEFRDRSRDLVDQYWPEIVAVATELSRTPTLDNTEVELIADAAAGVAEFIFGDLVTDLTHYRQNRGNQ